MSNAVLEMRSSVKITTVLRDWLLDEGELLGLPLGTGVVIVIPVFRVGIYKPERDVLILAKILSLDPGTA